MVDTLTHDPCNAYCKDRHHADVFFLRKDMAGEEARHFSEFCRSLNVRFVAVHPAPEVRPEPFMRGWEPEGGTWRDDETYIDGDPSDYTAWLLTWEETWELIPAIDGLPLCSG